MNPIRIAADVVTVLADVLAPVKKMPSWPDGEQPLIDGEPPLTGDELTAVRQLIEERFETALEYTANNIAKVEPMPGWFRGGFDDETSAESTEPEAGVDSAEGGPTPSAAHTLGVEHTKVTGSLLVSAAIGLREYANSDACEAPVYWHSIADQLDPIK